MSFQPPPYRYVQADVSNSNKSSPLKLNTAFPQCPLLLPAMTPEARVDTTGVFFSLTRARNEKSRPSLAMAKIIRGRGNKDPKRLIMGWSKKKRKRAEKKNRNKHISQLGSCQRLCQRQKGDKSSLFMKKKEKKNC